jgi:chloride channel protein, CIC family
VSAPLGPGALPGLAAAVAVGPSGGVNLGAENPIVVINVGPAVWLGTKATRRVDVPAWLAFTAAGTIGAMFGTPVGAVLVLTETPARPGDPGIGTACSPPSWSRAPGH